MDTRSLADPSAKASNLFSENEAESVLLIFVFNPELVDD